MNVSLLGIMFVYSSRCLHLYDNIKKSQLLCLLVAKKNKKNKHFVKHSHCIFVDKTLVDETVVGKMYSINFY